MSLQFSDTTNKSGIIQRIEKTLGMADATITGNTTLFAQFTSDVNSTLDDFMTIAGQASGTWQFDDSNHTKDPIIYTNLVQGQKDYHFTTDEQSNLILDIYRIGILPSATATLYQDIYPIDAQSGEENGLTTDSTTQSVPYQYDKTANAVYLDPPPSYNATNGMKLYINRESFYFTVSDTTRKPGVPGLLHEYFVLKPAYRYARDKGLANADRLFRDIGIMEKRIVENFSKREKDIRRVLKPKITPYI